MQANNREIQKIIYHMIYKNINLQYIACGIIQ